MNYMQHVTQRSSSENFSVKSHQLLV